MAPEDSIMPTDELIYWVGLSRCLKLGPTRLALLRGQFKSLAEVWSASLSQLKNAGLDAATAQVVREHCRQTDLANSWQEINDLGLKVITIDDPAYPKLLRQIYDPPALLFYRGDLAAWQATCLAVVGTRRATSYGTNVTAQLVEPLARAGLTIVSGLAYGIDTVAHRTTLSAGGLTLAILASGLDQIYPTANKSLAQDIVHKGGAIISEFPPGTAPLKQNFPFRNRIIAGLSAATLVIEAAPGSGSLITARSALEANREIFAVPGSILSPVSQGTNELIKLGAHLVTTASDVLNVLGLANLPRRALEPPPADQAKILSYLTKEPKALDDIVREAGLKVADITAGLSLLELSGHVRNIGNQQYIRLD